MQLTQYSYLDTIGALRATMRARGPAARINETVMLQNSLGFAQLSLFRDFDGIFAEGGIVNTIGLLGARSTAICWTYNSRECCASDLTADAYFQRRLYMKVFPMAPFPQADHCIGPDPKAEALYRMYGPLFQALVGAKWLLKSHAVNITADGNRSELAGPRVFSEYRVEAKESNWDTERGEQHPAVAAGPSSFLVANAFESEWAPGFGTLWAAMLGGSNAPTKALLSVKYLPAGIGLDSFETLLPGVGNGWVPVPASAVVLDGGGGGQLTIPLKRGCAIVRVQPSTIQEGVRL